MKKNSKDVDWIADRIGLFKAKAICDLAQVDYNKLKNWKSGRSSLSEVEAARIKKAMKDAVK